MDPWADPWKSPPALLAELFAVPGKVPLFMERG